MLTEGAKPGTPNITPKKIYPDGINLFIEVIARYNYNEGKFLIMMEELYLTTRLLRKRSVSLLLIRTRIVSQQLFF